MPERAPSAAKAPVEVVDPVWLLKALALSLGAALFCTWLAACLLFYQGTWQLVLHPSPTIERTPTSIGVAFSPVRFGDFSSGTPHLTGWWIPAPALAKSSTSTPHYSALTVLYLHGGSGSLSDTLPMLSALHNAGLNVFAIDYRGFGASDISTHPDADRMSQDASAALDYLLSTRHIAVTSIVPMGSGLGASLAVQLAHDHPSLTAVILDNPDPDPAAAAVAARPSRVIPVRLLFGDRFAISNTLATLTTPKLLLAGEPSAAPHASLDALFQHAASPKYTAMLPPDNIDSPLEDALHHFLDQYAPQR